MDKYDKAIEYLTAHPEEILQAWKGPFSMPEGCLFSFVTPDGHSNIKTREPDDFITGCLTQIKGGAGHKAFGPLGVDDELTRMIKADDRLPYNSAVITVESLHVLAEWQRKIDTHYNRPI